MSNTVPTEKFEARIKKLWKDKRFQDGVLVSDEWYKNSGNAKALAWGGRCQQQLNRHEEAVQLLDIAYAADIKLPWLFAVYVKSLIKLGRHTEACNKLSDEINKSEPDSRGSLYKLHQEVYRHLKQWDLAKEAGLLSLASQMRDKPYSRAVILQKLINKMGVLNYLEIGVNDGSTFLKLEAKTKLAVDPRFKVPGGWEDNENEHWFEITSDAFFLSQKEWLQENPLDLVFIDGLHTYEQSLADVLNSLQFLRPGGLIVMHDCLPTSDAAAAPTIQQARTLRGLNGKGGAGGPWMGDVYRTILHLRSLNPELHVCVLDSDCGLGFVRPGQPDSMLSFDEHQIRTFSYQELTKDMEYLLNLKPVSWFDDLLGSLPLIGDH